jgi:transposase
MAKRVNYPDWVEKYRQKGTNISCVDGRYYLYSVSSKWNKEKGRAQKKTDAYLGRITEQGLIPKTEKPPKEESVVTVKEYGATKAIVELGGELLEKLRDKFGTSGEVVFAIAVSRLIEQSPFKRTENQYVNSYISEILPDLKLSPKDISLFLKDFGNNRAEMVEFMQGFIGEDANILFDGTSIVSSSDKMSVNRIGYNAHGGFDPQFNLLYAFSADEMQPVYYRVISGNVRDVTALSLTLEESGMKNGIVVADKGFASEDNFKEIESAKIKYIMPLKRNSTEINYEAFKNASKSAFDGHFMFKGRPIWFVENGDVCAFLDPELKTDEERGYLSAIERKSEGYTIEKFYEKQHEFGSIALKSNTEKTAKEIFLLYKQRREIEQSFDFLKNLLAQDKSYMQSEKSLESWAFINHIALLLCYKLYHLLKTKELISQYSIADFIAQLKYIYKIKINGIWKTSEITKKTAAMISKLGLHITYA